MRSIIHLLAILVGLSLTVAAACPKSSLSCECKSSMGVTSHYTGWSLLHAKRRNVGIRGGCLPAYTHCVWPVALIGERTMMWAMCGASNQPQLFKRPSRQPLGRQFCGFVVFGPKGLCRLYIYLAYLSFLLITLYQINHKTTKGMGYSLDGKG